MMLTRRGWCVVGVVAAGMYMAAEFGPRSLNAVVAPALVTLGAALFQVRALDRPSVERRVPAPGFVGDERTVELAIDADTPIGATVRDRVADTLTASGNDVRTTIGRDAVTYAVTLDRRGQHGLGPLSITVTDVLGLAYRRFEYDETEPVVAYPPVYEIDPTGPGADVLPVQERQHSREEFDGLREYRRGDALRDIHWKSSAKRAGDELFVSEYTNTERRGAVTVAVAPDEGRADDAATAAASLAVFLLDHGLGVGLVTPEDELHPTSGTAHRRAILTALARLGPGELDADRAGGVDVVVRAPGDERAVYVDAEGHTVAFDRMVRSSGRDWERYKRPFGGRGGGRPVEPRTEVAP